MPGLLLGQNGGERMRGMRPTRRGENLIAVGVFVLLILAWLSDEGVLW